MQTVSADLSGEDTAHPPISDGLKKVTALLLAMGAETAARLIGKLDEDDLRLIAVASKELPRMQRDVIEALVEDFAGHFARHSGIDDPAGAVEAMVGQRLKKKETAISDQNARRATNARSTQPLTREDLLNGLVEGSQERLNHALNQEHDAVIAIALSVLPAQKAGECLGALDAGRRGTITHRLIGMNEPHPLLIRAVLNGLYKTVTAEDPDAGRAERRGRVASVLNAIGRDHAQEILSVIAQTDPTEAERLSDLLFDFEDLVTLDGQARTLILDGADTEQLATALSGADETLTGLVLDALGARARRMVEAELKTGTERRKDNIRKARQIFASRALALAADGKIVLKPGNNTSQDTARST